MATRFPSAVKHEPAITETYERALSASQAAMVGVMGFMLTAMNGVPLLWSSLPFVLAISGLIILQRNPRAILASAFSQPLRPITLSLTALAAISMVCAIATGEGESIGVALLRSVGPLIPYFALAGIQIRARHVEWIIGGFVLGIGFLLLRGTIAFYTEWGIPDLNTLLWARYDQFRMNGYMNATLGNLSQLGLYITLTSPLLIAVLAYFRVSRALAWAIAVVLILAFANSIISGSRTAIALILPIVALIYARRGAGPLLALVMTIAAIIAVAIIFGVDAVNQSELINRFIPSEGSSSFDASAVERVDSIYLGWATFLEYPLLGVGPGMSYHYIPYGIPHQSIIHMLLELGVLGGVLFTLISLLMIGLATHAVFAQDPDGSMHWRAAWLMGPAGYCLFGILGGISFTMSIALVWVGIVYVMIPIAYAKVIGHEVA